MGALLEREVLIGGDRGYEPERDRDDWTEQRNHLSGGLGRAVLDRFPSAGWVTPARTGRAVRVADRGRSALVECFGIEWTD